MEKKDERTITMNPTKYEPKIGKKLSKIVCI